MTTTNLMTYLRIILISIKQSSKTANTSNSTKVNNIITLMRNKSEYKVNEDTSGAGEADREIIMEELSNLSFNKTIPILVVLMLIKLEKYRYTMSKENINLMIKTTNSHLLKNQKDRTSNVVSRQFSHI